MNIIGIYPGRFQPPTEGNYRAYQMLKSHTGTNTFITTNDTVDLPNSPLTFQDKQNIWVKHGVPVDKVILAKDPVKAVEITQKFGADRTVVVFAMTVKEATMALRNPNGYFVPFTGLTPNMEPLNKKGYILSIPDEVLYINQKLNPSTLRKIFGSKNLNDEKKKSVFKQLFGWYDISLFDLLKKKFSEAGTVKERVTESKTPIIRRTLKPFIKEIVEQVLGQLSTPQSDSNTTDPSNSISNVQNSEEDDREKRAQAANLLKQKDTELKTAKKERDFQKQKTDYQTRFVIPSINKDIQQLKKAV